MRSIGTNNTKATYGPKTMEKRHSKCVSATKKRKNVKDLAAISNVHRGLLGKELQELLGDLLEGVPGLVPQLAHSIQQDVALVAIVGPQTSFLLWECSKSIGIREITLQLESKHQKRWPATSVTSCK